MVYQTCTRAMAVDLELQREGSVFEHKGLNIAITVTLGSMARACWWPGGECRDLDLSDVGHTEMQEFVQ